MIDVKSGGSVQGLIAALNDILERTVYRHQGEGGTYIVPGHGYLADEHEVVDTATWSSSSAIGSKP